MNYELEIKNLSKEFVDEAGYKKNLFRNISFNVETDLITTVLAPTGTGKTSFLKIVSGLEKQSSGELINKGSGRTIFIPSEPSSFPWLTVEENIGIVLNEKKEVKDLINLVGLEGYEDHIPHNKSFGFRFRISLARALALKPSVIILDEPFTKMDVETKAELYNLIRYIGVNEKQTILMGTTNITEAVYLSDKIILMKKNPAELLEELHVELPRDRNLDILNNEEFHSIREKIEKIYKEHQTQKLFNLSI